MSPITEELFSGIYANDIYPVLKRELFGGDEPGRFVASTLRSFGIHTPSKLLDLCCGDFTDGIYLSGYYNIDAVDGSPEFVRIAKERIINLRESDTMVSPNKIHLGNVVTDLITNKIGREYEAAYCISAMPDIDDPRAFFKNVHNALMDNGLFIFDFRNKDAMTAGTFERSQDFSFGTRHVKETISPSRDKRKVKYTFTGLTRNSVGDTTLTKNTTSNFYGIFDVEALLSGLFHIESAVVAWDLPPRSPKWKTDKDIVIIARKK